MRLAIKFAFALTLAFALLLVVQATLHVREIAALQEREIRDDVGMLGRTLAAGTAELWKIGGRTQAEEFIRRANSRRDRTLIRLRSESSSGVGTPEVTMLRLSKGEDWSILATAPVRIDGRYVGSLEIERRLPREREYYSSLLHTQVWTTLVGAVVSGLVALAWGLWLIGRPIRQLSELAHRVADGDFSLRTNIRQRDEIGRLASDFDAMTDKLAEAQRRVRKERRARTTALEKLRHADRLGTVGKLASSMAHELGTPLNVVSGRATMIANDGEASERVKNNARTIAEQASRMTAIIRELLDFARRKPLERQDERIGDVLGHAVSLMEPMCEDHDIEITTAGELDLMVQVDASKTMQVLTNLIMNAIHAMPDGGRITLQVRREHVAEPPDRHASGGQFVKISVRDEGIGIGSDRLEEIFEDFFTTKGSKGTGLGLSVCHGIVREHGGFMQVDSELGKGSCFNVYLPEKVDS